MGSHKIFNLNSNEGFVMFLTNYTFYWCFHFKKEMPINCLFTQWKWTHILDLGPWKWSALNMGHMNKRPSRMPGQFYSLKSGGADNNVLVEFKNLDLFCGDYLEVLDPGPWPLSTFTWKFFFLGGRGVLTSAIILKTHLNHKLWISKLELVE